jgi:hypothetical protein
MADDFKTFIEYYKNNIDKEIWNDLDLDYYYEYIIEESIKNELNYIKKMHKIALLNEDRRYSGKVYETKFNIVYYYIKYLLYGKEYIIDMLKN